ncbi:methyl-accepting chemotaxis protein [Sphingomonas parapaucimobilis]|uniref:methyl-accepting chemotaxis protein n=1 Tax=Sphingomonas parapaucimobilis TaxID=28213 RepID=UPI0035C86752
MAQQASPVAPSLDAHLGNIADRLIDIAGCVASEAEAATASVRSMSDQAERVASLAASLEAAAGIMAGAVRQQAEALAMARESLTANKLVVDTLDQSIGRVASISATIATIAQESRILSLNARIEAARAESGASAFAVVATEMAVLATRTKTATDDIGANALAIAHDIGAAGDMVAAYEMLVSEQDELLPVRSTTPPVKAMPHGNWRRSRPRRSAPSTRPPRPSDGSVPMPWRSRFWPASFRA